MEIQKLYQKILEVTIQKETTFDSIWNYSHPKYIPRNASLPFLETFGGWQGLYYTKQTNKRLADWQKVCIHVGL